MNVGQNGCSTVSSSTYELNQETTTSTESITKPESDCLPLPPLDSDDYVELVEHDAFSQIKSQFLEDIKELQERVRVFYGNKYDAPLDTFYSHIENPPLIYVQHLLPIYQVTRRQIHWILEKIKSIPGVPNPDSPSTSQATWQSASDMIVRIDSVLIDSLDGIEMCFPGIHQRFQDAFSRLQADDDGVPGKLKLIKIQLLKHYIRSFMEQNRRTGALAYFNSMEIHVYNSMHNLCCDWVRLEAIKDPYTEKISPKLKKQLLKSLPFSVNESLILRKLADMYYNDLSMILQQLEKAEWLTKQIPASKLVGKVTLAVDGRFFKEVNLQFKTKGEQALDFWSLADVDNESGHYSLQNSRAKLLAWVGRTLLNAPPTVFTPITSPVGKEHYIVTLDQYVYWVSSSEQTLHKGDTCPFDPEAFTPLELHHLKSVDLSSWPKITAFVILTQAAEQTSTPAAILPFLLDKPLCQQLNKLNSKTLDTVNIELENKVIYQHGLKQDLVDGIAEHVIQKGTESLAKSPLWLNNRPLVEATLAELSSRQIDINPLISKLTSDVLLSFSTDSYKQWMPAQRCQKLYRKALEQKQGELIEKLLLTGHCNKLINDTNKQKDIALTLLSKSGYSKGVDHLISLPDTRINHKNQKGLTALMEATKSGHLDCIHQLFKRNDLNPNRKDIDSRTALSYAVKYSEIRCVETLLTHPDIDINLPDINGISPLHYAARLNRVTSLRHLLAKNEVNVNILDLEGRTPLYFAALNGCENCIRTLCQHPDIFLNPQCTFHCVSPLFVAAQNNHSKVVEILLNQQCIKPNITNSHGTSPLMTAAKHAYTDCVQLLLSHPDTNLNIVNVHSETAYTLAKKAGHTGIVEMLRSDHRYHHLSGLQRLSSSFKLPD